MKRALFIGLACLALAGCVTDNLPAPVVTVGSPSPGTVSKVQQITTAACAFEPTAATVAKLFTASSYVTTADAIAHAICNAVTSNVQAEGNVPGRYVPAVRANNGQLVIVKGRNVRK